MFKWLTSAVLFCWIWTPGMVGPALADVVGPHTVRPLRPDQMSRWERELVRQWLEDYGYDKTEAVRMLAGLQDPEVHALVMQAENMGLPYGGGALEAVIAVLLILILVIIILRLLNKEVIIA